MEILETNVDNQIQNREEKRLEVPRGSRICWGLKKIKISPTKCMKEDARKHGRLNQKSHRTKHTSQECTSLLLPDARIENIIQMNPETNSENQTEISPITTTYDCEAMVDEEFFFFFCSCQENRSVTAKPIQFIFI